MGFMESIIVSLFCMSVVFITLVVIQYLVVISSNVIRSIETKADNQNQASN